MYIDITIYVVEFKTKKKTIIILFISSFTHSSIISIIYNFTRSIRKNSTSSTVLTWNKIQQVAIASCCISESDRYPIFLQTKANVINNITYPLQSCISLSNMNISIHSTHWIYKLLFLIILWNHPQYSLHTLYSLYNYIK